MAARAREPFCRVEDLRRVHGIGPHTLASAAFGLAVEPTPPACPEGDVGRRGGEGYRPGGGPRGAEAVSPPAGGPDARRDPEASAEGVPGASTLR